MLNNKMNNHDPLKMSKKLLITCMTSLGLFSAGAVISANVGQGG